ncbi:MAG: hypothetical protein JSW27_23700 [Phycisphaerales bacterium]|nr:MAG: hypothetical protein JSW27_23700 [Phycisphaerales bacterium]
MYFQIEERRAWLRSHTHTIVLDCDPDFARFAREPSGRLRRMLRIWLAERRDDRTHLCAFLGTLTCCVTGPPFRELHRLLRLTTAAAPDGATARRLRRDLISLLRQRLGTGIEASA